MAQEDTTTTPPQQDAAPNASTASQESTTPTTGPLPEAEASASPDESSSWFSRVFGGFSNPFSGFSNPFSGSSGSAGASGSSPSPRKPRRGERAPERERSALEKMRDKVAEFDEDYKDVGERLLGGFTQVVGYLGPFLLMVWIGSDLGKFFEGTMGTVPAYGLAFTIEGVIAACTVSMGRAFAELASGRANYGRLFAVVVIWFILNASSAFGLYLVITHNNQVEQGSIEQFSMVIRVVAIALADLGCSAVLMFKGRSLQKHIESIRKRAAAIGELSDAERSIKEADKNAELREQQMQTTLKIQEDLSKKIGQAVDMVMTTILERMEKSLKEDPKNERRYGNR